MRALIVVLLLLQVAGAARADRCARGRAKQKVGIALLVVGSAVLMPAGPASLTTVHF